LIWEKERERERVPVARETVPSVLRRPLFTVFSQVPIKRFLVAHSTCYRDDKGWKGCESVCIFRWQTTMPTQRQRRRTSSQEIWSYRFFPVTSAGHAPALSTRMEIRSVLVPASLSFAFPTRDWRESTTFTSGVSRFRLKSPFHSELYLAVISRACQATLFRVALSY